VSMPPPPSTLPAGFAGSKTEPWPSWVAATSTPAFSGAG
jgi:hypothetical protein